MRQSIQAKILGLSLSGLVICTLILGALCVTFVSKMTTESSLQHLNDKNHVTSENISHKFFNIEMYVTNLAAGITRQLESVQDIPNDSIREWHTETVRKNIIASIGYEKNAVAVYMRYNPKLAPPTSGIFMAKLSLTGPIETVEPTDFSKYDPSDIEHVGWYYIPVRTGKPMWMSPYLNKNIDIYMISYVVPLYIDNQELGVAGVDLDFNSLIQEVSQFKLFKTDYAYLEDSDGHIVYHPSLSIGDVFHESDDLTIIRTKLNNGMYFVSVTPTKEINEARNNLILKIIVFAFSILVIFSFISILIARTITKPLKKLTNSANKLVNGDIDAEFDIEQDDEIGDLSKSFTAAKEYLKIYLGHMRGLAYKDSLTCVRNKTAYDVYIQELNEKINSGEVKHYGIVLMDTNDLKYINDNYGHDHGNIYLIESCKLICRTFAHSPVFRIGGDEFVAILQGDDLVNYDKLLSEFTSYMKSTEGKTHPWENISIAIGFAYNDPAQDFTVDFVFKRADEEMYKNKRMMKKNLKHE